MRQVRFSDGADTFFTPGTSPFAVLRDKQGLPSIYNNLIMERPVILGVGNLHHLIRASRSPLFEGALGGLVEIDTVHPKLIQVHQRYEYEQQLQVPVRLVIILSQHNLVLDKVFHSATIVATTCHCLQHAL